MTYRASEAGAFVWFALFRALVLDKKQRQVWCHASTGLACIVIVCGILVMGSTSAIAYNHFLSQQKRLQCLQRDHQAVLHYRDTMKTYVHLARRHPQAFVDYHKHHMHRPFTIDQLKEVLVSKKDHGASFNAIQGFNMSHKSLGVNKVGFLVRCVTLDAVFMHDSHFMKLLEYIQGLDMGLCLIQSFDLKRVPQRKKLLSFHGRIVFHWFTKAKKSA